MFYGNKNSSLTNNAINFNFQRYVPNRFTLETFCDLDGVPLNGYVCVEYDLLPWKEISQPYDILSLYGIVTNGIIKLYKAISETAISSTPFKEIEIPEEFDIKNATKEQQNFLYNSLIDKLLVDNIKYSQPWHNTYDSTVWVKVYDVSSTDGNNNKASKYWRIADLNAENPLIKLSARSPATSVEEIIAPYFKVQNKYDWEYIYQYPVSYYQAEVVDNLQDLGLASDSQYTEDSDIVNVSYLQPEDKDDVWYGKFQFYLPEYLKVKKVVNTITNWGEAKKIPFWYTDENGILQVTGYTVGYDIIETEGAKSVSLESDDINKELIFKFNTNLLSADISDKIGKGVNALLQTTVKSESSPFVLDKTDNLKDSRIYDEVVTEENTSERELFVYKTDTNTYYHKNLYINTNEAPFDMVMNSNGDDYENLHFIFKTKDIITEGTGNMVTNVAVGDEGGLLITKSDLPKATSTSAGVVTLWSSSNKSSGVITGSTFIQVAASNTKYGYGDPSTVISSPQIGQVYYKLITED